MGAVIKAIFGWKRISDSLKETAKDKSRIAAMVDEQLVDIIKEMHPDDYEDYIHANKEEWEEMKKEFIKKYSCELQNRVSSLLGTGSESYT